MSHLFCFGLGYSARVIAERQARAGWQITGTSRSAAKVAEIQALGYGAHLFTGDAPGEGIAEALGEATHVLISAAPKEDGDAVLRHHAADIAAASSIKWIGYLSTIGVYGDFAGAWIDESAETKPASVRGQRRVVAESDWLNHGGKHGQAVQVFRLAGIYGPGTSPLVKVQQGTAKRIVKPGQVFNRIHVNDIAGALIASMAKPDPGAIYNVADDEPAAPQDVIAFAAALLGIEPPPEIAYNEASMTPMARSFYGEVKRVSNARLKDELGWQPEFPTFREGLQSLTDRA